MNTTTAPELAAVASTDITTLAPAARAAVALSSAETRKQLVELVTKSSGILTVTNADGRHEAHAAGMVLKSTRVAIEKTGKAAREDATAFSKAVIKEEAALVALIEPEESRVLALRDEWDAKIEAERQAKIAQERARTDAIKAMIAAIVQAPANYAGSSAELLASAVEHYSAGPAPSGDYMEFLDEANAAQAAALAKLSEMHAAAVAAEQAEADRAAAIEAEKERIAAERAELARQMAEEAERIRIESERLAAERVKADQETAAARLAIQQEQSRLAEVAAEQERQARAEQAERDSLARIEALRVKSEHDKAAAAIQAQQDALARQQAEFDARIAAEAQARSDEAQKLVAAEVAPDSSAPADAVDLIAHDLPPPESCQVSTLQPPDAGSIVAMVMSEYGYEYEEALSILVDCDFASLVKSTPP
jgi:hypothetical protein